jgi:hypothetical protein
VLTSPPALVPALDVEPPFVVEPPLVVEPPFVEVSPPRANVPEPPSVEP